MIVPVAHREKYIAVPTFDQHHVEFVFSIVQKRVYLFQLQSPFDHVHHGLLHGNYVRHSIRISVFQRAPPAVPLDFHLIKKHSMFHELFIYLFETFAPEM